MTLAIGVKYPWGDLNRLPPPGSKVPEAVILASDSRFSRKLPCGYIPISDSGTKLFKLGRDAGAIYAGVSEVGEKCLDELRWKLTQQEIPNSGQSRKLAQRSFQDVYKHYLATEEVKPDDTPLYIIVGACDTQGRAELYQFDYATNFKPKPITGLKALGWSDTASRFDTLLKNRLQKKIGDELSLRHRYPRIPMATWLPMPITADHVAILMVASLADIVESNSDETIGGMIQCAVITSEGISLREISDTANGTNEGPGWRRVTARPKELITVTGTFGFYSFSD